MTEYVGSVGPGHPCWYVGPVVEGKIAVFATCHNHDYNGAAGFTAALGRAIGCPVMGFVQVGPGQCEHGAIEGDLHIVARESALTPAPPADRSAAVIEQGAAWINSDDNRVYRVVRIVCRIHGDIPFCHTEVRRITPAPPPAYLADSDTHHLAESVNVCPRPCGREVSVVVELLSDEDAARYRRPDGSWRVG